MSALGVILVVVLLLLLFGGVGPHVYPGTPWRPGYGFGNGGLGVIGVLLVVVLILWLMGYV